MTFNEKLYNQDWKYKEAWIKSLLAILAKVLETHGHTHNCIVFVIYVLWMYKLTY